MTRTLGIHIGHDGGAAICDGLEIVVACNEERLTRRKYANGWWLAVKYCLDTAGLSLDDIDIIVFSNSGEPLEPGFDGELGRWTTKSPRVVNVDHHTSHAIGAYCFSPFASALVFVGDAGGNNETTESAFLFEPGRWEQVMTSPLGRRRAAGLGTTYEGFTNFLGFADQESGKTMALAAYGEPQSLAKINLFSVNAHGQITSQLRDTHYWGVGEFSRQNSGFLGSIFPDSTSDIAKNVAAYVQTEFELALLQSIKSIRVRHRADKLILSGGIGLNCVANQRLSDYFGTQNFYAFPACSDCGLAIGNALFGIWRLDNYLPRPTNRSFRFGRSYGQRDILRALNRHPDTVPPGGIRHGNVQWTHSANRYKDTYELISEGKTIAWFQGKSETGPRALGGRSIIGDPARLGIREKLNSQVKQREWFRPLAPSILEEVLPSLIGDSGSSPYMNMAPVVSESKRENIRECVHVDGSARIQSVQENCAPEFFRLLSEMAKNDSFPAVLNTSFNVQEPIVETPGDAIATFLRSKLDALIIEDFVVTRQTCGI